MNKEKILAQSPLSIEEIELIDSTLLTKIERHKLRILAHFLATFKLMANGVSKGPLPKNNQRLEWLIKQPSLMQNQDFIYILLDEFQKTGYQLEYLAEKLNISPLELCLNDLIQNSIQSK